MHEELRKEVPQWSCKVQIFKWAHQSRISKGEQRFDTDSLLLTLYCLYQRCAPQYMGDSAPEKVKLKIVEMLYSWTVAFPNETKISEAYQTLKRQGGWRTAVLPFLLIY